MPVSVFSFLWLSLLEDDSQLRIPLCGILVTSRYVMVSHMENVNNKKFRQMISVMGKDDKTHPDTMRPLLKVGVWGEGQGPRQKY